MNQLKLSGFNTRGQPDVFNLHLLRLDTATHTGTLYTNTVNLCTSSALPEAQGRHHGVDSELQLGVQATPGVGGKEVQAQKNQ